MERNDLIENTLHRTLRYDSGALPLFIGYIARYVVSELCFSSVIYVIFYNGIFFKYILKKSIKTMLFYIKIVVLLHCISLKLSVCIAVCVFLKSIYI